MLNLTRSVRSLGDDRGVTLAEILVATVIISIGLVGLAVVIPISSYGVFEGNALSTATFLAEQKLEETRNATWATTPSANDCLGLSVDGAGAPLSTRAPFAPSALSTTTCTRTQPSACTGTCDPTYSDESAVSGYPAYSRTVRIYPCDQTIPGASSAGCAGVTNANMRLVRVTVSYRPISGVGGSATTASKSAVLEMIVSRRE